MNALIAVSIGLVWGALVYLIVRFLGANNDDDHKRNS